MSLDDVVGKNNIELDALKLKYKILDHKYGILLEQYRKDCHECLVEEFKWPHKIAKAATKLIHMPKSKKTLSDYLLAFAIGNLPKRYVQPIAKCNNTNPQLYTGLSILSDIGSLGLAATTLWGVNALSNFSQNFLGQAYEYIGFGENVLNAVLIANAVTRLAALPYRIYEFSQKRHTPSYASIISPNPLVFLAFNSFILHDYVQSKKEKKYAQIALPKIFSKESAV